MKKIFFSAVLLSTYAFAFSVSGIADAVDGDKAMKSVDTDKAMSAAAKGTDISMNDVKESVDTDKAIESVDKEKLMQSVMGN